MKKKILVALFAMTMTAAMITGCGNKPSQSLAAESSQESTVESSEASTEESTAETEPSTESEPSTEAEPTQESESAPEQTEQESSVETASEPTEASTEESQDSNQAASEEAPKETEAADPAVESSASVESVPETTTAPETAALTEQAEQPQAPDYAVTAMSATMYVKNSVNLRQGPGTGYAKVGSLNKGDQVNVTGQADNGWYQLDSGAFVSNKYLDSNAPATTVATVPGTAGLPTDLTGAAAPVLTDTDLLALPATTASTGVDFLNYLNQQRSAAGLGTLTWDDGMAAVAQRRAQEITKGLDHSGNVEQYGEIIQQAISGSATEWYNNWYNFGR